MFKSYGLISLEFLVNEKAIVFFHVSAIHKSYSLFRKSVICAEKGHFCLFGSCASFVRLIILSLSSQYRLVIVSLFSYYALVIGLLSPYYLPVCYLLVISSLFLIPTSAHPKYAHLHIRHIFAPMAKETTSVFEKGDFPEIISHCKEYRNNSCY